MKNVQASAPGKLILLGEHAVVYGYPCIITAVSQSIQASAHLGFGNADIITAPQVNNTAYTKEVIRLFKKKYDISQAVSIETHAEFTDQTGLGSSSASTVAVCKALNLLFNKNMTREEVFELSFKAVVNIQGSGSGADIAAAVFGGTLYYKNRGEITEPLVCPGMHIVIGNTGHKAKTKDLIQKVAELRSQKFEFVENIFKEIWQLVEDARDALLREDYESLGLYMNDNHVLLQNLGVSSEKLDQLVEAAYEAGAYGAKLSGAGGGDNMFALVDLENKEKVERAIEQAGGTVIRAETDYAIR